MASLDETVYKLKEFNVWSDASAEARYDTDSVDVKSLMESLEIKVQDLDEEQMTLEFDIIGIGPPIVNALRRILIAEIPTMAIDKIHMYNNTTVIPDEVLGHRLGMIPIKIDPRPFVYKVSDTEDSEEDTLKFELKVKCTRKPNAPKDVPVPPEIALNNHKVLSKHLKFIPLGKQKSLYDSIRPVHEDILIAVLNPGHFLKGAGERADLMKRRIRPKSTLANRALNKEIDLEAFCTKNIGRVHAKFSPVSIASYRLMPQIKLKQEIVGDSAKTLAKIFPGVVKVSKKKDREIAKIINPRKIMCNRNIYFYDDLKDAVEISKLKDHYIFTVESTGALMPDELVLEAIDILNDKCTKFLNELKSLKI